MKKLIAATALSVALVAAPIVTAPPAAAYPGCYYSWGGCYLGPGWYGGRYWYGGPWFGWAHHDLTNSVMGEVTGCPVAWVDGRCPVR